MRWLSGLLVLAVSFGALRADESPPLTRIAFGSCADQDKPQPIWKTVVAAKPEVFLFLGDNIYGDSEDMKVLAAKYAKARTHYTDLFKTCKVHATWDDHDYGADDGDSTYSQKDASQKLFLDFLDVPADSPRRKQQGVYTAEVFGPPGKRVQIILLDGRYFRSPLRKGKPTDGVRPYLPNTDEDATMLGETQWKWLEEQLKVPAEVRLIGSGVQVVSEEHPFEKWANFPKERDRLFKLLKDTKAKGVIFLSGDRHLAEISALNGNLGYPLFDVTASGLTQANRDWRAAEKNARRIGVMTHGNHFGFITIDWSERDPRVSLQIRAEDGDITLQQRLRLSTLRPSGDDQPVVSAGAIPPSKAVEKINERVTVEMLVKSTGSTRDGKLVFLNSESNYREKTNFTVVLISRSLKEKYPELSRETFRECTIRVTGTVATYRDNPQIVVDDPEQLKVLESDKKDR